MTSQRSCRTVLTRSTAERQLVGGSGTQFGPLVVDDFLGILAKGRLD